MGDESGNLNLDTENLANVAKGASHVFDPLRDGVLPAASVLLLIVLIWISISWARKRAAKPLGVSISQWPPGLKASLWPLIAAFALTHAFSAASVYYNTSVANPSTSAYFETLGIGRLSSLSHAHLFAHATMYFVLAVLVQFTSSGRAATIYAPVSALWAGVFDVFAWWGLKKISPSFEVLSALCGTLFSVGFLLMGYAILREALRSPKTA